MKIRIYIVGFHLLLMCQTSFCQSFVLNTLFEQSYVVYKGKVERISYGSSNGEGDHYGIITKMEKAYKGNSYDEIGIRTFKFYIVDTIKGTTTMEYDFQVKEDSTYIFFIKKPEQHRGDRRYYYFADLTNTRIEGIPFNSEIEKEIEHFSTDSYLNSQGRGDYILRALAQSSPNVITGKVQKIKRNKSINKYSISVESENNKYNIIARDLNCVCKEGKINIGEEYLFFSTPSTKNSFFLVDRWLGVFALNSMVKGYSKKINF